MGLRCLVLRSSQVVHRDVPPDETTGGLVVVVGGDVVVVVGGDVVVVGASVGWVVAADAGALPPSD